MKYGSIILLALLTTSVTAQQTISGTITDKKGDPVMNTNIYFEGSYDGTTSDVDGSFKLTTDLTGSQLLVASFIGYEKYTRELFLSGNDTILTVVLKAELSEINEVEITAGIFSASDKKKSATLNSFDIATTASAMGDIYGAYATMPGSQKVGEDGMLFVRGGIVMKQKPLWMGCLCRHHTLQKCLISLPGAANRHCFFRRLFSVPVATPRNSDRRSRRWWT